MPWPWWTPFITFNHLLPHRNTNHLPKKKESQEKSSQSKCDNSNDQPEVPEEQCQTHCYRVLLLEDEQAPLKPVCLLEGLSLSVTPQWKTHNWRKWLSPTNAPFNTTPCQRKVNSSQARPNSNPAWFRLRVLSSLGHLQGPIIGPPRLVSSKQERKGQRKSQKPTSDKWGNGVGMRHGRRTINRSYLLCSLRNTTCRATKPIASARNRHWSKENKRSKGSERFLGVVLWRFLFG